MSTERDRSPIQFKNQSNSKMSITQIEINMARDMVPEYSGGSKNLAYFLNQAENYLNLLKTEENTIFNRLLLETVKSKLTGEARNVLINSRCTRWADIKEMLTQKFGDPRSEELLLHDLTTCYQNFNENYEQYHERIKNRLQILLEHVSVREINRDIRICKENNYNNQALSTFKAGVLEPYCRHLMSLNITSLEQALIECRKLDNCNAQVSFMKFMRSQSQAKFSNHKKSFNHQNPKPQRFFVPHQTYQHQYQPVAQQNNNAPQRFPAGPIQFETRPVKTHFPTRSEVFGKSENKPTPMSICTRNTSRNHPNNSNNSNKFRFTPQSRPTFATEELFNVENDEYQIEDGNFPSTASQFEQT